ncbi:YfiR/HmsC-like protein, partial [Aduncisulcus paluster]
RENVSVELIGNYLLTNIDEGNYSPTEPSYACSCRSKNRKATSYQGYPAAITGLIHKKITKYVLGPDKRRMVAQRPVTVAAVAPKKLSRFFKNPDKFKLVRWPEEDFRVLFIDVDNPRIIAAVLNKVRGKPILTIGQSPDFLRMGGMINLVESGSRFKLQVNICAARNAG